MYVPETFAIFSIIHCTNTHLKYKALLSMKVIVLLFYIFNRGLYSKQCAIY